MSWKIPSRSAKLVTGALIASFALHGPVRGQAADATATVPEEIIGTWAVVSQYLEQNGNKVELFAGKPNGMITFDNKGYFVGLIQTPELPKIASNNRLVTTSAENEAMAHGNIAYFGRYVVNDKKREIKYHFDGCTYTNWIGQDQTRKFILAGNELRLTIPSASEGAGVGLMVLKRVK